MSDFEVLVESVSDVTNHPNADRLSLVKIRDYLCVSAKLEDGSHRYKPGDKVVYIPEASVVPDGILRMYDFWDKEKDKGILAGKAGNRVKAIKLRGVLSQGIILPAGELTPQAYVGHDVAEELGITKWVPEIPTHMNGKVVPLRFGGFHYDIENLKKYPGLMEGKTVVLTEKLHGTFCCVGYDAQAQEGRRCFVSSKGFLSKGLCFDSWDEENIKSNLYMRTVLENEINEKVIHYANKTGSSLVFLFGEVYGKGVQDLQYGLQKPQFAAFDMYVDGWWLDSRKFDCFDMHMGGKVPSVPFLYQGPFDRGIVDEFASGESMIGGGIREGVVITPVREETNPLIGRLILKHVSEAYLTRKGNATEFN